MIRVSAAAMMTAGLALVSCSPSPPANIKEAAAESVPEKQISSGAAAFAQCAACHSLEPGVRRAGPSLAKVIGRQAGSEPGFAYSRAMRESGIIWTPEALDRFIDKPQVVVPGNRMTSTVSDPIKREQIIAYLK